MRQEKQINKIIEAEWKAYFDEYEICATVFVCSNCKENFCSSELTDEEFLRMMKYCPNCGAKMKGGEDNA
jgi:ribosomal protein L33